MLKNKIKENPTSYNSRYERTKESAVSPVVGVMLMLVVVIIIATIVSGFAGGLIENGGQKTPTLTMDVQIANSGTYRGSEMSATVTGVSEPIDSNDIKIITSWTTTVKTNNYVLGDTDPIYELVNGSYVRVEPGTAMEGKGCILSLPKGTVYHGGAEVVPGVTNSRTDNTPNSTAPYGFGPGVENITTESEMVDHYGTNKGPEVVVFNWQYFPATHFGNYSLEQGTVMMAEPAGRCFKFPRTGGFPDDFDMGGYGTLTSSDSGYIPNPYQYKNDNAYEVYTGNATTPEEILADGGQIDGMQAMLGCGWENLRGGDVVNVKVVYTPSGKTIFNQDVVVDDS